MTDYARIRAQITYSENSDYEAPVVDKSYAHEPTPDEYIHYHMQTATQSNTGIDLAAFSTITNVVVVNRSSTAAEIVLVSYMMQTGTQGASGTLGLDMAANDTPETITDNDANGTFLTNGALNSGYVVVANAEDSGNDDYYIIGNAAANVLTLSTNRALTTDNTADTTATLTFANWVAAPVNAGGIHINSGTVLPAYDLYVWAVSGTPEVDIYILGS